MSDGWKSNAVPGSVNRLSVYGARYPPPVTGVTSSSQNQHPPASSMTNNNSLLSGQSKKEPQEICKFKSFEAGVSDAWDIDTKSLIESTAKQGNNSVNKGNQPVTPSRSNRERELNKMEAIQRLVIGYNEKKSLARTTQDPSTSSYNLYPKLPDLTPPGASHSPPTRADNMSSKPSDRGVGIGRKGSDDEKEQSRYDIFNNLINGTMDLSKLQNEAWKGIPHKFRPDAWRILLGYLPSEKSRRKEILERKRAEYYDYVEQYFHTRYEEHNKETFRQISIDIPRMCPLIPLFQQKIVQEIFERILYIWAIRHPASGYVQGINDLVTPFFVVFLSEHIKDDVEVSTFSVSALEADNREGIQAVEADSFWCVSTILDEIQDHYTFAQHGIQRKICKLSNVMSRVDSNLHNHLLSTGVEYLQFAFRWMNNLLMREIPLRAIIRLWDTYIAESKNSFPTFHVYVCASFLRMWSKQIQAQKDFQGVMLMLQNLPTSGWRDEQISELTAYAYSIMSTFEGYKSDAN